MHAHRRTQYENNWHYKLSKVRLCWILLIAIVCAYALTLIKFFHGIEYSYVQSQDLLHLIPDSATITEAERSSFNSILPRKLYTVVGLESSGTTLVASIISNALNVNFRQGSSQYEKIHQRMDEIAEVQVQHFSLPWGGQCYKKIPPIVDVVLPPQCSREDRPQYLNKFCPRVVRQDNLNSTTYYPNRYFLNITSNKEWYEQHGTEVVLVIVVRDEVISMRARTALSKNNHCKNELLAKREAKTGIAIIDDAIKKYILDDGSDVNIFGHNVVLVSYEMLNQLEETYIRMLYKSLGINSTFMPKLKNGNEKYIKESLITLSKRYVQFFST